MPSTPNSNILSASSGVITPPAPITGILILSLISFTISHESSSVPRCPPAFPPSTIIALAPSFSEILASFREDTIGTIGVPCSFPIANISLENPAPQTTKSIPSSIDANTSSAKSLAANIILTPSTPLVNSLAFLISSFNSFIESPVPAIRPIPPSFATAAASFDIETFIAIPPWIIGYLMSKFPILNLGNFILSTPQ